VRNSLRGWVVKYAKKNIAITGQSVSKLNQFPPICFTGSISRGEIVFRIWFLVGTGEPRKMVTDKLRSYGVAHRELMPDVIHDTSQYADNRA
jgi:hypothetical protein